MDKARNAEASSHVQELSENIITDREIESMIEDPESGTTAVSEEEAKALKLLSGYNQLYIDHEQLKKQNEDYIGWICIPGTDIGYPVYKCSDNSTYLHHDADHNYLYAGCIYRDEGCTDTSDNTILYGHNMRSGSMFAHLNKYLKEEDYFKDHPFVVFYPHNSSDFEIYEIYSIYTTSASKATKTAFRCSFASIDDYRGFLRETKDLSMIKTYHMPSEDDQTLTLATCTGAHGSGKRCIVHAGRIY